MSFFSFECLQIDEKNDDDGTFLHFLSSWLTLLQRLTKREFASFAHWDT